MKELKKIGVWMDHSMAHLIEFSSEVKETKTITSDFTFQDRNETLHRSESEMHHKENQKQTAFYKKLIAFIQNFDEVILFGPTAAKMEFYNFIKEQHKYDKIKIEVKNADKMTDSEQHLFVREYFKRFDIKIV
jgi:stalled ribosome rescue protein Dom34